MADKAASNEVANTGFEVAAQEEEDPVFPSIDRTTKPPSLGYPHPPNLTYPPASFRSSLNVPASFSVPPAQMQPFFTYNSQPLWAGNSLPNFNPFLPMPNLPGQIAAPFAGSGYGFPRAGATVNPFGRDPFMQFPTIPLTPCGSNAPNLAMDSMQSSAEPLTKGEDKTPAIPLICLLCPKQPKFSDVSHLLTHISSKSHLAAQFRLQHSGKNEDKLTLDQYKQWSDDNGVDKLVANRIAAKELKKPAKRSRLANVEKKEEKSVKLEPDDSLGINLESARLRPNPNTWQLHAPRDSPFDPLFATPTYLDHGVYPFPDSPQGSAYIKQETSRSSTETGNSSFLGEAAHDDGLNDSSKLKGVIFPGMDMFDSATPDQKRKRNQKKHASVVRKMEMMSASIGQDEDVWDITMSEVTRTRNVYDSPSIDGSPESHDELPSTTKKRRGRRSVVASTGPRRQTRAVTRAASNARVGKRRSTRQTKKLIKVEDELDSEDESSHRVDDDDDEEEDNTVAGGDVFQDRRQISQDIPGNPPDNRFDLSFRNAMHNLPSNMPLMTSSVFSRPSQSFFPGFGMKENDSLAFPMPQPGAVHGFFAQPRQSMQVNTSSYNPLCLHRQDNYPFLYGGPAFEASKPPTPAFPAMPGADYGSMDTAPSFQPGQNDEYEG
ncbi:hypothetical protein Daus18300_013482 [Diaporthe australafricana]|uniref:Uncharacterized protein n=1 Tax=Diaporthe australafricana TaxID=127596 RepID=A0ABR3VYV4_9PEZI